MYNLDMAEEKEAGSRPLSNADLLRVLSPLLLFLAHCIYLAFWSPDPFLNKWLDGSFSFFVSLVLCNIVRARVVAAAAPAEGEASDDDGGSDADTDGVEGGGHAQAGRRTR
jgi:hypothetical protein